jgi:hypothetical protein
MEQRGLSNNMYNVEYRYSTYYNAEWYKYCEVDNQEHAIQMARENVPLGAAEVRVTKAEQVWEGFPK